jgi:hypothetical protein
MMSDNIARNILSSQVNNGIINYPIQLHLVGLFYKIKNIFRVGMRMKDQIKGNREVNGRGKGRRYN